MTNKEKKDSGLALLFTLIMVAMFFLVGMVFMARSNLSAKLSNNLLEAEEARLAANLALENIKTNIVYSFKKNLNLTGAEQAYGYTLPAWEMKRYYDVSRNNFGDHSLATVSTGIDEHHDYAMRNVMSTGHPANIHGYSRGFRTVRTHNGEISGVHSVGQVQTRHNIHGEMNQTLHWIAPQMIVDQTWQAGETVQTTPWDTLSTGGDFRTGFQYSYLFIDKTGTININSTKQTNDATTAQSFSNLSQTHLDLHYPNVDLSKMPGWESCNHDPQSNPIYNYDELYGRKEPGASSWEIAPPSSLTACNLAPTNIEHPKASSNGVDQPHLSYKHFTSPYSIEEAHPAYAPKTGYQTLTGVKSHTRYDLDQLNTKKIAVSDLIKDIPYLKNWHSNGKTGSELQVNTIAANIIDYADKNLDVTTNYTTTIDPSTYMGNERVPYLNEVCVGVINRELNGNVDIYAKAELVWLYDGARPGSDSDYSINFKILVKGQKHDGTTTTLIAVPDQLITISSTGLETDNKGSAFPAVIDTNRYSATKPAKGTLTATSPLKRYSAEIQSIELLYKGKIIDIAQLPSSPIETKLPTSSYISGRTSHGTAIWAAKDPRNNTHSNSWTYTVGDSHGWYVQWGDYYDENRDQYAVFPSGIGDWGSFYMPNIYVKTQYDAVAADQKDYEPDAIISTAHKIKFDGSHVTNDHHAIDYTKSSHCFMPDGGGITHPVELGSISRGADFQTLNFTSYNLDTANLNLAQFKASNLDNLAYGDGMFSNFYQPVAAEMCNGGDLSLLDEVYLANNSLDDITKEKKVYGKFNANSTFTNSLKLLLMSLSVPLNTQGPNSNNALSHSEAHAWAHMLNSDTKGNVFFPRFMTKFTFDKLQPITVTNAPSDPMRWGSKRLGSLFNRDHTPHSPGTKNPFGDREQEILLSKMKDLVTVRYTHYSGIILSESMLYKAGTAEGFRKLTDAVVASAAHPARGEIHGKQLSQKQYRIDVAYDHFLDKIIILDYKYMGKKY